MENNMKYTITQMEPFGLLLEPQHRGEKLMDLDVLDLRRWVMRARLIVLRGFQTFDDADSFAAYCERWGEISIWPFGKVLELIEHDNPEDHIFDHSYVPLHWDGMYRPQVPELQIFHCVTAPLKDQGGRTTFSNTIMALEQASAKTRQLWSKVTGSYERKMEFYASKIISPVITRHPYLDFSVIRYNEPPAIEKGRFVNPPNLEFSGVSQPALNDFHRSLTDALYASTNYYAHEWQAGDIVIADNFSLLHGREAYTTKSPRHIQRVHILSHPPFNNPGLESYQ
jgi:alpha-ketoglutarate-dependent taurine dioxygenase